MTARTIPEVAAELRLSPRLVRKLVVENGLCLVAPGSNRRRMTDDHVTALVALGKGEVESSILSRGTREIAVISQSSPPRNVQNTTERLRNTQQVLGDRGELCSRRGPTPVFKTSAFSRSAIPPVVKSSTYAMPDLARGADIHIVRSKRQRTSAQASPGQNDCT